MQTVRDHPREMATAFGARVGENALFYLFTVFVLEYGEDELGFERNQVLIAVIVAAAIGLFTNLFYGTLSDRVGRKPVYLFGAVLSLVFSFFYIPMLDTGSLAIIVLATVIGLNLGHDAMYGVQAAFFAESFSVTSRYTGAGMGYHLAARVRRRHRAARRDGAARHRLERQAARRRLHGGDVPHHGRRRPVRAGDEGP